ncbi:uridine kinase family protein [Solibacillus silvestris]|uniref:uridine kinase family protein n=1 Tax=Solibacillus silvestris TaxID=76853 RepID=UPI003F815EAE
MQQLLEEVKDWTLKSDKRLLIGISGHGAAGKSTFASDLKNLLNPEETNLFTTDPYIIASEVRNHTIMTYNYENEEHRYKMTACHRAAHHLPSLERDVQMIKDGAGFFTIDAHYARREWMSPENRITIVEGMSVAFIEPELFDLLIYFFTDGETEFQRRAVRDINERGMQMERLRHSHHERRIQYELFMHPYHRDFDIIVKNSSEITYLNSQFNRST